MQAMTIYFNDEDKVLLMGKGVKKEEVNKIIKKSEKKDMKQDKKMMKKGCGLKRGKK